MGLSGMGAGLLGGSVGETDRYVGLSAAVCVYENIPETGHHPERC